MIDELVYIVSDSGISIWDHKLKQTVAPSMGMNDASSITVGRDDHLMVGAYAAKPLIEVRSMANIHISGMDKTNTEAKGISLSKSHVPEKLSFVRLSNSRDFLIGGSVTGNVYLWSLKDRSGDLLRFFQAHFKRVTSICFSYDDKYVAVSSEDAGISVWLLGDLVTPTAADPKPWISWHSHSLPVKSLSISSMSDRLISASSDRTVKLWSLSKRTLLHSFQAPCPVYTCQLSLAEKHLFYAGEDGNVYIQSLSGDFPIESFKASKSPIHALAFNTSGALLMTGSSSGMVKVWAHDENQHEHFSFSLVRSFQVSKGVVTQICSVFRSSTKSPNTFPKQLGKFPLNAQLSQGSNDSFSNSTGRGNHSFFDRPIDSARPKLNFSRRT